MTVLVGEAQSALSRPPLPLSQLHRLPALAPGSRKVPRVGQSGFSAPAAHDNWYGYNRADPRQWIFDLLRSNAPTIGWWCGDFMVSGPNADMHNGDLGAATSPGTGFGLVCANVSSEALQRCCDLGRALSNAYQGRVLPDGSEGSLDFLTAG